MKELGKDFLPIITHQLLELEQTIRIKQLERNLSDNDKKKLKGILKNIENTKNSISKSDENDWKQKVKNLSEVSGWLYKIIRLLEFMG